MSLLWGVSQSSIWCPVKAECINEDGLLMSKIVQMFLDDFWPNAQDVIALPVTYEMQEVHCLHHIICADASFL